MSNNKLSGGEQIKYDRGNANCCHYNKQFKSEEVYKELLSIPWSMQRIVRTMPRSLGHQRAHFSGSKTIIPKLALTSDHEGPAFYWVFRRSEKSR
eukprot:TCALIF_02540-PA protein Name:"Protein of unknown function" AED:0.78 eAED:0.82 QI:0/0/0/1/1/1/2/0/94